MFVFLLTAYASYASGKHTFQMINSSNELSENSAQLIVCTRTGRMIISTSGNLNFYNGASFSHINAEKNSQYQLLSYNGGYRLYFDTNHHLWIKNAHTLTCVNLLMEKFDNNVDSIIRDMGCAKPLHDFFVDSEGGVWLLSEDGLYGVNQKRTYRVIQDLNIMDLDVYDDLLLTFYESGEEVGQDVETGKIVHRTRSCDWDTAMLYSRSSTLLRYNDGYYQLRSSDKESILLYFDVDKRKWTLTDKFDCRVNHVMLHDDCLYLPSESGYWVYNIKSGAKTQETDFLLSDGQVIRSDCNMIAFDRQNGMWITTEKRGVLYSRPALSVFKTYSRTSQEGQHLSEMLSDCEQNITDFHGMKANCIAMDSRGWSWIGTTKGLCLYKTPQSEPVVFSRKNGLYNDVVHSVCEDADNNIWVATSNGISYIGLNDNNEVDFVNSFNSIDGVPCESFENCKSKLLPDGNILMLGIDHAVMFLPEDLKEVNTPHPYKLFPKLIRIMANGNYVEPYGKQSDDVYIDRAVARTKSVVINNSKASVSLTFSALNYYRPLQTYYRVRLKGSNNKEEWTEFSYFNSKGKVDSRGMLHVPLLGLEPGNYELEVQASMYPDQWDGEPFVWKIIVSQPWWQTTGIRWLLALIMMLLAITNLIFYLRNEQMRLRRNHEESDMIRKIRLFVERFDGLSHEIISPSQDDMEMIENKWNPEFIRVMMIIIPFVQSHKKGELTMSQLGAIANMDVVSLYKLIISDIHKSPRELSRIARLHRVEEMLRTTDMTVEQIADACGFYTPNYMMGTFFHLYKQTPFEYRESHNK